MDYALGILGVIMLLALLFSPRDNTGFDERRVDPQAPKRDQYAEPYDPSPSRGNDRSRGGPGSALGTEVMSRAHDADRARQDRAMEGYNARIERDRDGNTDVWL